MSKFIRFQSILLNRSKYVTNRLNVLATRTLYSSTFLLKNQPLDVDKDELEGPATDALNKLKFKEGVSSSRGNKPNNAYRASNNGNDVSYEEDLSNAPFAFASEQKEPSINVSTLASVVSHEIVDGEIDTSDGRKEYTATGERGEEDTGLADEAAEAVRTNRVNNSGSGNVVVNEN